MKIYATEDFYKTEYLHGKNPAINTGFLFYAMQASQVMDTFTFSRLHDLSVLPEVAAYCCCELAESLCMDQKQREESGGKTSERIGSYSVSFAAAADRESSSKAKQREIVFRWLGDTGLCYKGV